MFFFVRTARTDVHRDHEEILQRGLKTHAQGSPSSAGSFRLFLQDSSVSKRKLGTHLLIPVASRGNDCEPYIISLRKNSKNPTPKNAGLSSLQARVLAYFIWAVIFLLRTVSRHKARTKGFSYHLTSRLWRQTIFLATEVTATLRRNCTHESPGNMETIGPWLIPPSLCTPRILSRQFIVEAWLGLRSQLYYFVSHYHIHRFYILINTQTVPHIIQFFPVVQFITKLNCWGT